MKYDNSTRTLTIGARKGSFKGMKQTRDFNVVFVSPEHPVANPYDAKGINVRYNGKSISVKL